MSPDEKFMAPVFFLPSFSINQKLDVILVTDSIIQAQFNFTHTHTFKFKKKKIKKNSKQQKRTGRF